MNLEQLMSRLEELGTDLYRKTWPRHGVRPPLFGVLVRRDRDRRHREQDPKARNGGPHDSPPSEF
ncbi:MAG: hypothetical protein ACYTGV_16210 [Planctomycetota bacterium]|jgi:hypothetical protein